MTRQHIRFSALRSIFWGTLLLFLDFDLNFRFGFSFTLPLLPNCIGFWLVARGTRSLAADRPSLGLLGPFWLALGLWSLQQFFPGLSPHIPGAPLPRQLRPCLHPAPAVAALPGHGSRSGGRWITPSSAQGKASREGQAPPLRIARPLRSCRKGRFQTATWARTVRPCIEKTRPWGRNFFSRGASCFSKPLTGDINCWSDTGARR